jgi:hypothetical protein
MVIAIDPLEEFEYVLEEERKEPRDTQTIWKLVTLDIRQRARLEDEQAVGTLDSESARVDAVKLNAGNMNYLALRAGLRGVENFPDRNGGVVEFKADKMLNILGKQMRPATDDFLSRIPKDAADEIADAIRENLRMSPEEGKE